MFTINKYLCNTFFFFFFSLSKYMDIPLERGKILEKLNNRVIYADICEDEI